MDCSLQVFLSEWSYITGFIEKYELYKSANYFKIKKENHIFCRILMYGRGNRIIKEESESGEYFGLLSRR